MVGRVKPFQISDYNIKEEKKKIIPALRKLNEKCTGCEICLQNCVF